MANKKGKKKTEYHVPPNKLREKVGVGGIDPLVLERAELFIVENDADILPYAREMILIINTIVKDLQNKEISKEEAKERLVPPIMELKANGSMFQYILVSEIAGVVLDFLETIKGVDKDALDILNVHEQSLSAILTNKLKGSGGAEGKALAQELYDACKRYYKKHGK